MVPTELFLLYVIAIAIPISLPCYTFVKLKQYIIDIGNCAGF
jgi:hypothetical protein